jgi:hypothetical protein
MDDCHFNYITKLKEKNKINKKIKIKTMGPICSPSLIHNENI